ncbi:hypothetical protein LOR_55c11750 [Legionella oakridgensis RV-2-2007]|nr:hypothetical protein LOR_55c11750 [Legionella oakridgensis RV-2-2007]
MARKIIYAFIAQKEESQGKNFPLAVLWPFLRNPAALTARYTEFPLWIPTSVFQFIFSILSQSQGNVVPEYSAAWRVHKLGGTKYQGSISQTARYYFQRIPRSTPTKCKNPKKADIVLSNREKISSKWFILEKKASTKNRSL